jgi:hypothetical protein
MHITLDFIFCLALLVPFAFCQGPLSIFYLTNCNTGSGDVSQVAYYADQTQSGANQSPDLSITSSDVKTWEGVDYTWTFKPTWTFFEEISSGAADPAVPVHGFAGCGRLEETCADGSCAVAFGYNCFKGTGEVLYATADITCVSLYFCAFRTEPGQCPGKYAER